MLLNFIHRLGIKSETIDLLSFLLKKIVDNLVREKNKRTALFQAVDNSTVFFLIRESNNNFSTIFFRQFDFYI